MNPRELRAKKRALRGLIFDKQAEWDAREMEREWRREHVRSAIALQADHLDHVVMYEAAKRPSGGRQGEWMDHLSFSAKGAAAAAMIRNCSRDVYPRALAEDVHARHHNLRKYLHLWAKQAMERRRWELDKQAREELNQRMAAWAKAQEEASLLPINVSPQMLWAGAFWIGIISLVISLT